jgi:outer membrane autotransporter protein
VAHVDGTSDAGTFALANGRIDKGLFAYDLVFDDANNDYLLVGLPGQGMFETTAAVASSQEIWRETADAWSTRQENLRDLLASSYGVTALADPPVEGSTAPMASLWVSALGSWSERDDNASVAVLDTNLEFDLSYSQDIYGVVGAPILAWIWAATRGCCSA